MRNGVVILENGALPEGTRVKIFVDASTRVPWAEVFKEVAGKAEHRPSDMARNHDHYLHGHPKPEP